MNITVSFKLKSFYRATLCISAVFAVARCLSVRPSVTLVRCTHNAEQTVKRLCRPGSPIILVYSST